MWEDLLKIKIWASFLLQNNINEDRKNCFQQSFILEVWNVIKIQIWIFSERFDESFGEENIHELQWKLLFWAFSLRIRLNMPKSVPRSFSQSLKDFESWKF